MQNRSMYITPIPWPSKYVVAEKSAMGSSAYLRPLESQLQQENSSFSVGMKHQWQPKKAVFSMGCPTHETRGGSAYMEQMSLKLQQKKASFSAGMEPQWQPKKAAFSVDQQHQTWGKEFENEASRRDKGTSNGFDEECKELGRMFREKLQEFAMILSKEYYYSFPAEYFDVYHGSFNKEEFLKMEKSKEKTRRWETDSSLTSEYALGYFELGSNIKKDVGSIRDDIGDGLHPSKGTCNEQIDRAANAEGSFDIVEKEVQIEGNCSQQKGKDVADWEEKNVESLAGKNKSHSIMFIVTTAGRLEFLSPLLKGGLKTGIDVAAQQVVSGAMQGINGTMFAYGVTGSGKTHTMHGEQKSPEILPLAVKDIFKISPAKLWKKRKKGAYWKL